MAPRPRHASVAWPSCPVRIIRPLSSQPGRQGGDGARDKAGWGGVGQKPTWEHLAWALSQDLPPPLHGGLALRFLFPADPGGLGRGRGSLACCMGILGLGEGRALC